MKRKLALLTGALVAITSAVNGVPVVAEQTSDLSIVSSTFLNPPEEYQAGARYVVDCYDASNPDYEEELVRQLKNLKEQGFSYLELENHVDWKLDRENFLALLRVIYTTCNGQNMKVDLRVGGTTMGATEIAGNHPVFLNQTEGVTLDNHELTNGMTFTGQQLYDADFDNFDPDKIVAALAISYTTNENGNKIQTQSTVLDTNLFSVSSEIVEEVSTEVEDPNGGITGEKAKSDAHVRLLTITYEGEANVFENDTDVILYYMSEGNGSVSSDDYYTTASAEAYCSLLDEVLDDSTAVNEKPLKELMIENGGLFTSDGGDNNQSLASNQWSEELLDKIQNHFGYDFTPYLAVQYSGYLLPENAQNQINNDWNQAFAYLFCDYNQVIVDWAKGYNSGWRSQVGYSTELDHQIVASSVTNADTESLYSRNEMDNYLSVVSPARLADIKISNFECSAVWTPYMSTWKELLFAANTAFTTGINRMFYHVISFNMNENLELGYPGYSYNDMLMDWGVTNPLSEQTDIVNGYVNRIQYLMQTGINVRDFMIYNDTFSQRYEVDDKVSEAGFTYDIVSPSAIETEKAQTVEDGMIDPKGGQYRAFVVSHLMDDKYMPLSTAKTILMYAENGIPIVVVGNEENFVSGLEAENFSTDLTSDTEALKEIWDEIAATGNLTYTESEATLATALKEIGILPSVNKEEPSKIYSNRLTLEDGSTAYYLYNTDLYYPVFGNTFFGEYSQEEQLYYFPEYAENKDFTRVEGFAPALPWGTDFVGEELTQTLYLKGEGVPYMFDAWSGKITPVSEYEDAGNGYIAVTVTLKGGDTAIIGFANEEGHAAVSEEGGKITMSGNWDLSVDSWSAEYESPANAKELVATKHTPLTASINELVPWDAITFTAEDGSEVEGLTVCGVGTYTTTFTAENCDGAILAIEEVSDLAKVYVNGIDVNLNQESMKADISDAMVEGTNILTIEVATNYNNYMNATKIGTTTMFEEPFIQQSYGILGEITITPYIRK